MTYQVPYDLTLIYFLDLFARLQPYCPSFYPSNLIGFFLTQGLYTDLLFCLEHSSVPMAASCHHLNLNSKATFSERPSMITKDKAFLFFPPITLIPHFILIKAQISTWNYVKLPLCVRFHVYCLFSASWWQGLCLFCSLWHAQYLTPMSDGSIFVDQLTDLELWEGIIEVWIIWGKFT